MPVSVWRQFHHQREGERLVEQVREWKEEEDKAGGRESLCRTTAKAFSGLNLLLLGARKRVLHRLDGCHTILDRCTSVEPLSPLAILLGLLLSNMFIEILRQSRVQSDLRFHPFVRFTLPLLHKLPNSNMLNRLHFALRDIARS